MMLRDKDAMATVAVKDFAAAKAFYGGKLGLEEREVDDETGVATYRSGDTSIVVYRSEFAGTNRATSVTWGVGDEFDAIVAALQRSGVEFERYESLVMTLEDDVHVSNGFRAAWFTDPDGNILHVNNMQGVGSSLIQEKRVETSAVHDGRIGLPRDGNRGFLPAVTDADRAAAR